MKNAELLGTLRTGRALGLWNIGNAFGQVYTLSRGLTSFLVSSRLDAPVPVGLPSPNYADQDYR
jgi:hypothetical protein